MKNPNKTNSSTAAQQHSSKTNLTKILIVFAMGFLFCTTTTNVKAQSWNLNGNTGSGNYFLGTTNNFPLLFRTNNTERFRIQPNGFIGVGVSNPLQRMDINGNLRVRGNIYVDNRVFQEGQFATDSVEAGLIAAGDITANKITTDTLQTASVALSANAHITGEARFSNTASFSEKVAIGAENPADRFEVHGGDAKFFGDVKLEGNLVNPNMASQETRLLYFDADGKLTPLTPQRFEELIWNPKTQDFNECILSNEGMPMSAKWYSKQNNTSENYHLTTCWSVNIGTNNFVEGYKLNVAGAVNTNSNYYINGTPIRQSQWKSDSPSEHIYFNTGNVGIGTINPTEKLQIEGNLIISEKATMKKLKVIEDSYFEGTINVTNTINTKKVVVCATGWCDYVFEKDYKLTPLSEVEKFIAKNKHLPEVPSAKEIENNQVDLFEMQKIQMKKIEELTLYLIELKKENEELRNKVNKLSK